MLFRSSDEQINFLLRTKRTFDDSANPIDRPFKLLSRAPIYDSLSALENFLITRVAGFNETVNTADQFSRLTKFFRSFQDSTTMLSDIMVGDGGTFFENKGLKDIVYAGTQSVNLLRQSGDTLESITFFYNKYLDPDVDMLDSLIVKIGRAHV